MFLPTRVDATEFKVSETPSFLSTRLTKSSRKTYILANLNQVRSKL